ncbi:hypothetical protein LOCC1_G007635 [Lachnellula occidentalis]|uniref:Clr5 domain-containing protein n=1 Tax=Lachnellula occidentalis TaxID=215460 RepID=A0A8H8RDU9_9HELO|nr:hypothetical protein LOCC1_G007635 [Lachnellula occidentalis]
MSENEDDQRQQAQLTIKTEVPAKSSRLIKNDQKWNSLKEEIRRIYMAEDKTLPVTMNTIEVKHGFKASERKWKDKLKEWGFDKNIPAQHMRILVAKAEKRARDDGKETVFLHRGFQVGQEKLEHFKRRKKTQLMEAASPSAETPPNITYNTPGPYLEDGEEFENLLHNATDVSMNPALQEFQMRDTCCSITTMESKT